MRRQSLNPPIPQQVPNPYQVPNAFPNYAPPPPPGMYAPPQGSYSTRQPAAPRPDNKSPHVAKKHNPNNPLMKLPQFN